MTYGKFATDREDRINYSRMREYRLARTKQAMEKEGIGCMVSFDSWDVRYISSVYVTTPTRWLEGNCVVLPRNGDPHLFAGSCFSPYKLREEMPWLNNKIWPAHHMSGKLARTTDDLKPIVDAICNIMAEHGISNEIIGLDGCTSELLYERAFKDKGMKVVDGMGAMFEARKIKNQDEIECVRMACSNAEAAFAEMASAIKPGVTEGELMGIGMNTLYRLGADEAAEFVVASGFRTNPLHVDYTDRQIRPGDLVIIDINGNCWQGYKSCYYRTFCCGKATQEEQDTYEECRAMMYAGMSGIKAGNTTWDIVKSWPDSPKYWGYDNWDDVTALAVGHGIGISLHELPFFTYPTSKKEPDTLEEGMVLAIENWTGKRGGKFGIRLEENLVVTKDGYDLLTLYPVDQLIECWS